MATISQTSPSNEVTTTMDYTAFWTFVSFALLFAISFGGAGFAFVNLGHARDAVRAAQPVTQPSATTRAAA